MANKTKTKAKMKRFEAGATVELPDGFEPVLDLDDLQGFLLPEEGQVVITVLGGKILDSSIDTAKSSVLLSCRYHSGPVQPSAEGATVKEGSIVGLWYKPGMKSIRHCLGIPISVHYSGELDTGKVNPMKCFTVGAKHGAKGAKIVLSDQREKSAETDSPFDLEQ